jgi:hypothetical protein
MSLKTKVQQSVDTAFTKLKDLSVTATFDNKIVSGFSYSTGSIVKTDQAYTTQGFLTASKSYESGIPLTTTTLTIKNNVAINFNRYSRVTINSVEYGCNIVSKDDFIVVLSLAGV